MKRRRIATGVIAASITLLYLGFVLRDRGPDPDIPALLTRVRQLNQLATVRYTIEKVIGLEEQKNPVGTERILLVMQATVEAGVDLASIRPDMVQRRPDGTLVIRLPAPQLLNVFVNDKETKVWDRQKTWWTPWVPYSLDLEKRARLEGLEVVKKAATDGGILRDAERNAETSIRTLLQLSGIRQVEFIRSSVT